MQRQEQLVAFLFIAVVACYPLFLSAPNSSSLMPLLDAWGVVFFKWAQKELIFRLIA
ncbi:hypothetical protein Pla22_42300 [Rubripirellula amarantea]|uniref:Uncharacterized protein n=1 Tax=Rubripirellula amarantea TaxID=2527999 RepID=A0A5C5WNQ8_9BACT|nr:hypothetical protein Pla22_42300 [Rubripirellula amarantea]